MPSELQWIEGSYWEAGKWLPEGRGLESLVQGRVEAARGEHEAGDALHLEVEFGPHVGSATFSAMTCTVVRTSASEVHCIMLDPIDVGGLFVGGADNVTVVPLLRVKRQVGMLGGVE